MAFVFSWALALLTAGLPAFSPEPVLAQPPAANKKAAPGAQQPGAQPPGVQPPGVQPPAAGGANVRQEPAGAGPSLGGFQPPRPAPETFKIEKELITPQESKEWDRQASKYRTTLRQGVVTPSAQQIVQEGARIRVYRMTLKENRRELSKLRSEILRDIRWIPDSGDQLRGLLLQELTKRLADLMDGNFHTRFHAVLMLASLDVKDADRSKQTPAVPYTPAYQPLLNVVQDADQDEAVKIWAVQGLERILVYATAPNLTREQVRTVVRGFADELQSPKKHFWYQMRLAEGIEAAQITSDANGTPFVVQTLAMVLVDKERHPLARAAAAKALGQLPLDANINQSLLANAIAQFAHAMALEYNKNPNRFYWKDVYGKLYLAYRPTSDSWKRRKLGLIAQASASPTHKKPVEDSYNLILPFVVGAIDPMQRPRSFEQDKIEALEKWLADNKPENERIAPGLSPLPITQAGPAAANARPADGPAAVATSGSSDGRR